MSPEALEQIRICRKVLRMVAELHVRGYQQLRIVPHLYSLGTWRCGVTPASNIHGDHGAFACDWSHEILPQYTSASGREYFQWKDAKHATPSRMADLFLERFPRVCEAGLGQDWEYAGWLSWMLHETYPDRLPIAMGEYVDVPQGGLVTIGAREHSISRPPGGRGPAKFS